MQNAFIPDYPGEEPEDKTSEEEISEKEAEENILNSLDKSEDYSEIINKINNIPDEKIRKVFLEFAEYSNYVGKSNLIVSQSNKKLSEKLSGLEEKFKGSHFDDPKVKEALTSIKTTIEESNIRNTLNDIFDGLLAKKEEIAEYISSPDGKERLERLKKTSSGKKIIKSVLSPFKKLKIASWIGAGIITITLGSPFAIFGLWKYYQSSSGQLDYRTTKLESSVKAQKKTVNDFLKILAEGPKNEEEENILAYFLQTYQQKSLEDDYIKQSNLENTLKDYSTTEKIEESQKQTTISANEYTDEKIKEINDKYTSLNDQLTPINEKISQLEKNIEGFEANLSSKLDSNTYKPKIEEIEKQLASQKEQITSYESQIEKLISDFEKDKTESSTKYEQLNKEINDHKEQIDDLEKKYEKLKKDLDKKQDKKPFKIF